jgi:PBP1b-binding outer membrane lipoprotein LpoB
MARRHVTPAIVLTLLLGACSAAPADPAPTDSVDAGPGSAVEQARSVVGDLEERSQFIDSQMRDPFSPP